MPDDHDVETGLKSGPHLSSTSLGTRPSGAALLANAGEYMSEGES
jgi:hypothetical protein